jgi:hypothetical protein
VDGRPGFRRPRRVRGGEGHGGRRARRERGAQGPDRRPRSQIGGNREASGETQGRNQALSDEEIQDERDDGAPIEILEAYFEARGWACERTAEGEIVASATGSWAQYELRGVWRPEDQVLQFLAFPDIKVAAEKRPAIFEALALINEQLWLGHFEMWSGSGLVVFRHSTILDTRADEGLSLEQAEAIAEAAVEECERFYPVFQFVLWGGKSPGEAIAAALIDTHGEA